MVPLYWVHSKTTEIWFDSLMISLQCQLRYLSSKPRFLSRSGKSSWFQAWSCVGKFKKKNKWEGAPVDTCHTFYFSGSLLSTRNIPGQDLVRVSSRQYHRCVWFSAMAWVECEISKPECCGWIRRGAGCLEEMILVFSPRRFLWLISPFTVCWRFNQLEFHHFNFV